MGSLLVPINKGGSMERTNAINLKGRHSIIGIVRHSNVKKVQNKKTEENATDRVKKTIGIHMFLKVSQLSRQRISEERSNK